MDYTSVGRVEPLVVAGRRVAVREGGRGVRRSVVTCPFCGERVRVRDVGLPDLTEEVGSLSVHMRDGAQSFDAARRARGCGESARWWASDDEVAHLRGLGVPVTDCHEVANRTRGDARWLYYFPRWLRLAMDALLPDRRDGGSFVGWESGAPFREAAARRLSADPGAQRELVGVHLLGGRAAVLGALNAVPRPPAPRV